MERKKEIGKKAKNKLIVGQGGGDLDNNKLANEASLPSSDYLVGKVLHTEKKVLESINKLQYVKDSVLKGKHHSSVNEASIVTASGELLSHHLRQTMLSRNQIETEFMKKKIHFVSEFKLYNDYDATASLHQAMQTASLTGFASNFLPP